MTEVIETNETQRLGLQWGLWLHFSQLLGYIIPILGFIVPIIIWQLKKADYPAIDEHGKNVVNWLISVILYAAICLPLTLIFVGMPLLILLSIFCLLFPIIGGIRANNNVVWRYPLALKFVN